MGLSPKYNDLGLGRDVLTFSMPVLSEDCL